MSFTMHEKSTRSATVRRLVAALVSAGCTAAMAANVTVNLCATTGSMLLPATPTALNSAILAYVAGPCSATSQATSPNGPVIDVQVGDTVTVNLQNKLSVATGLYFPGQRMLPDSVGAAAATASAYGARSYTFVASTPGSFLYEAAPLPNAEYQTAMGLHGALIVRPAAVALAGVTITPAGSVARTDATAAYATGSAQVADTAALTTDLGAVVSGAGIPVGTTITAVTPGMSFTMSAPARAAYGPASVFNDEAILVLSELDPALNNSADPATFDMRNYAPKYFLINGQPYPATAPIESGPGNKVMLRYINAGAKHHSMGVLGLRQQLLAKDAGLLPLLGINVAAETVSPGQTADAMLSLPATLASASKFAVYDASLSLHNNGADNSFGGMLTFVLGGAGAPVSGPTAKSLALSPNPSNGSVSVGLTAALQSTDSTVTAAEYFVDTTGAAGTGIAAGGSFGAASATASATLASATLAGLPSGKHTVYLHAKDANGKWGAFNSVVLNLDKVGPLSSALVLSPNPGNGTTPVALSASASDSATGNSNVTAGRYTLDGGAPLPMALNMVAPAVSLSATIAAPLAVGSHAVTVQSQDALGNWGPVATSTLTVLAAGPVTSAVTATPNPNNGTLALNSTSQVVRVKATITSTGSTVSAAEGFIDSNPATSVRGFALVASDGAWNAATESAYADIPLTNIVALPDGNHLIYVRGKDAVGNWGAAVPVTLLMDRTAPTLASATLTPSTVAYGAVSTLLTLAATDAGSGVAGGQYWFDGTTTPPAGAIAFTGTSPTINTSALSGGVHSVRVRVQDAAGNWSTVATATLTVVQAVNDSQAITANTSASQTVNTATLGLLANDQPIAAAGRTSALQAAPVRKSGSGTGTLTLSCPNTLGTAGATVGGSSICTNGAYRVNLSGVGTSNSARQTSKRGTFSFAYTETLNGVSSTATVTITVN